MKKFLLFAALAAGVFSMQAQKGFEVYYNGQRSVPGEPMDFEKLFTPENRVTDGQTLICSNWELAEDDPEGEYPGEFEALVFLKNTTEDPIEVHTIWTDVNMSDFGDNDPNNYTPADDEMSAFCYAVFSPEGNNTNEGACVGSTPGNIGSFSLTLPTEGGNIYAWMLHVDYMKDKAAAQNMTQLMIFQKDDESNMIKFNLNFTTNPGDSAVEGIAAEQAAPVYYNLQGMRVAQPENGIYLVKRGNKVTKEVVRR